MTWATFTSGAGRPLSIKVEFTVALRALPGDAAVRVWTIAQSAPGVSAGYAIVQGTFAATAAQFSIIPLAAFTENGTGLAIALNVAFAFQVEEVAPNVCRVTWAASDPDGYALVNGTYAAVTAALAFSPAAPTPFTLSAPCRINLPTPALVYSQACAVFCQKNIPTRSKAGVVFDSAAPCQLNAQLRELGSATIVARFDEAAPSSGERVIADTAYSGITVGWYILEGFNTGVTGAAGFLLGMQVTE